MPKPSPVSVLLALIPVCPVVAQTTVVPSICATLPGNAALSMPLRWSHGHMQVFVDATMLPPSFVGQTITGVRLRRPTLPGDGAYSPLQRTLTVRGGFQPFPAAQMVGSLTQNRPTNHVVLFGPAPVAVGATPAPAAATVLGDDYLQIQFTTPLPVVTGTLFLEFEASDAPLSISSDHWVDGIWFPNGVESGFTAVVGNGSCTTGTVPIRLAWQGAMGPSAGAAATLEVSGALTGIPDPVLVVAWLGLDPVTRPPGAGYLGFGGDLLVLDPALAGCRQWAPFDALWAGVADASGKLATGFVVPGAAAIGTQLAVQAAFADPNRGGAFQFSFTNGVVLVLNSVGVGTACTTMYFPAGSTVSPWPAFKGQMPVLMLDH